MSTCIYCLPNYIFQNFQLSIMLLKMNTTNLIVTTVFWLVAIWSDTAATHCKRYSLSMPYYGRYCPGDGAVTTHLLPHQCRYTCLQSTTCKAYSYNITEGTCKRFESPCPQAISDVVMQFAVFTEQPRDRCYLWIPYRTGDAIDPRMISTDNLDRLISRMQREGNDIVCHFHTKNKACYALWGASGFRQPRL